MSTRIMKYNPFNAYFEGTTCATADSAVKNKPILPDEFVGAKMIFPIALNGEGCYLEGGKMSTWLRSGINCPVAEVTAEAGQYTHGKIINLSQNKWALLYADEGNSSKGTCVILTKAGRVLTAGTAVVFNDAATDNIDAKRIDDNTFVVAYGDNGGSDYLCASIATVSGSVPTFGTEKEITAAAIDITDEYTVAVAVPRSGVLAFAYQLASDSKGYIIAATYTTTTIAAPGTAVEFEAGETIHISMDVIADGRVVIGFQDDDDSDYLKTVVATVSAAGVCVAGTAEAHSAAISTSIEVHKASENRGILSWLDGGDVHMLAFDIGTSGTTLNEGADATNAGTHLTVSATLFSPTAGILAYEDDAHAGDYGTINLFTIAWAAMGSGGTVTLSATAEFFAEASTQTVHVAANDNHEAVVMYDDAGASNVTNVCYAKYYDDSRIIDVRSSVASAVYSFVLTIDRDTVTTTSV